MATHSSILAWEIPWTEEPGGLQCTGLKKSQTRFRLNNNSFLRAVATKYHKLGDLRQEYIVVEGGSPKSGYWPQSLCRIQWGVFPCLFQPLKMGPSVPWLWVPPSSLSLHLHLVCVCGSLCLLCIRALIIGVTI